jgi:hypothetical protein
VAQRAKIHTINPRALESIPPAPHPREQCLLCVSHFFCVHSDAKALQEKMARKQAEKDGAGAAAGGDKKK